ncbi:hypothetical protein BESB_061350 [Besnoitia besnoiti]|uniref:Transmembrane protein n=1 Tax=Besnoitia besnoiti TaxID=94643 RepID=A0A2A9M9U6_BESBE|nr:hypothetical protein BESB_061350 [Besnoitia besnoiti]PFH35248.1 hypothetical protein BESB_061350 [Besnoitia besnoiti]
MDGSIAGVESASVQQGTPVPRESNSDGHLGLAIASQNVESTDQLDYHPEASSQLVPQSRLSKRHRREPAELALKIHAKRSQFSVSPSRVLGMILAISLLVFGVAYKVTRCMRGKSGVPSSLKADGVGARRLAAQGAPISDGAFTVDMLKECLVDLEEVLEPTAEVQNAGRRAWRRSALSLLSSPLLARVSTYLVVGFLLFKAAASIASTVDESLVSQCAICAVCAAGALLMFLYLKRGLPIWAKAKRKQRSDAALRSLLREAIERKPSIPEEETLMDMDEPELGDIALEFSMPGEWDPPSSSGDLEFWQARDR